MRLASLKDPFHLLATGLGVGLVPFAPGTAGSALALVPCWFALSWAWPYRLALAAAVFAVGIWVSGVSARRSGVHDHPAIVIDEIAAMLALTLVVPQGPIWLLAAFVLFRIFDIYKPWPIRDLDHSMSGGLGIMLDDMLAAVYAALCLAAVRLLIGLGA